MDNNSQNENVMEREFDKNEFIKNAIDTFNRADIGDDYKNIEFYMPEILRNIRDNEELSSNALEVLTDIYEGLDESRKEAFLNGMDKQRTIDVYGSDIDSNFRKNNNPNSDEEIVEEKEDEVIDNIVEDNSNSTDSNLETDSDTSANNDTEIEENEIEEILKGNGPEINKYIEETNKMEEELAELERLLKEEDAKTKEPTNNIVNPDLNKIKEEIASLVYPTIKPEEVTDEFVNSYDVNAVTSNMDEADKDRFNELKEKYNELKNKPFNVDSEYTEEILVENVYRTEYPREDKEFIKSELLKTGKYTEEEIASMIDECIIVTSGAVDEEYDNPINTVNIVRKTKVKDNDKTDDLEEPKEEPVNDNTELINKINELKGKISSRKNNIELYKKNLQDIIELDNLLNKKGKKNKEVVEKLNNIQNSIQNLPPELNEELNKALLHVLNKKRGLKVVAARALNWMKEHKLATIGIGLALLGGTLLAIPATHMMINSALWSLGNTLGWSAKTLGALNQSNIGLSALVKGGKFAFEGGSGLYTLGGKVGAEALYSGAKAKLVGVLAGLGGVSAMGLAGAGVKKAISSIKEKITTKNSSKLEQIKEKLKIKSKGKEETKELDKEKDIDLTEENNIENTEKVEKVNETIKEESVENNKKSEFEELKEEIEKLKQVVKQQQSKIESYEQEKIANQSKMNNMINHFVSEGYTEEQINDIMSNNMVAKPTK